MTFNIDTLIESIDNDHDGEYKAFIKGREVVLAVKSPNHRDHLNGDRQRLILLEKMKKEASETGEIEEADMAEIHAYMDRHILKINGATWAEIDTSKRHKVLQSLTTGDFWGLIAEINTCGRLEEEEKNC